MSSSCRHKRELPCDVLTLAYPFPLIQNQNLNISYLHLKISVLFKDLLTQILNTMPYIVLIFVYRKTGLSPAEFKSHSESSHLPLLQSLAGPLFPRSHARRYIQRIPGSTEGGADNANHPATVLVGTPADIEYDAFAEMIFDDEAAFRAFIACVSQPEAAERIAKEEEMFLDRAKKRIVLVDECLVTTGPSTDG